MACTKMFCMQIGNCVGAANHRYFIAFLISAVISTTYVAIMSVHAGFHIWPPLAYRSLDRLNVSGANSGFIVIKETIIAILSSAGHLSLRGLVLVYLFVSSVSVEIGLSVLLWQQLRFIYEGKTYLMHLSPQGDDAAGERDCRNLLRFFGCPYSASRYLTSFSNSIKRHKKWKFNITLINYPVFLQTRLSECTRADEFHSLVCFLPPLSFIFLGLQHCL